MLGSFGGYWLPRWWLLVIARWQIPARWCIGAELYGWEVVCQGPISYHWCLPVQSYHVDAMLMSIAATQRRDSYITMYSGWPRLSAGWFSECLLQMVMISVWLRQGQRPLIKSNQYVGLLPFYFLNVSFSDWKWWDLFRLITMCDWYYCLRQPVRFRVGSSPYACQREGRSWGGDAKWHDVTVNAAYIQLSFITEGCIPCLLMCCFCIFIVLFVFTSWW